MIITIKEYIINQQHFFLADVSFAEFNWNYFFFFLMSSITVCAYVVDFVVFPYCLTHSPAIWVKNYLTPSPVFALERAVLILFLDEKSPKNLSTSSLSSTLSILFPTTYIITSLYPYLLTSPNQYSSMSSNVFGVNTSYTSMTPWAPL